MTTVCLHVPSDEELSARNQWKSLGGSLYSTIQAHINVVKRREQKSLKGPGITVDLPATCEFERVDTHGEVKTFVVEIEKSIQQTMTSRFTEELVAKISADIGITGGAIPTGKLSSEVQSKTAEELIKAVQETLRTKVSYQTVETKEIKFTIRYKKPDPSTISDPVCLTFYPKLWLCRWDFYLYRVEYLSLRYKKNWLWRQVRDSMSSANDPSPRPLFSIRFYEAQTTQLSFTDREHVPDVSDADEPGVIVIEPLQGLPKNNACGDVWTLPNLAKLAFPVTKQELAATKRPARKPAMAKGVPAIRESKKSGGPRLQKGQPSKILTAKGKIKSQSLAGKTKAGKTF